MCILKEIKINTSSKFPSLPQYCLGINPTIPLKTAGLIVNHKISKMFHEYLNVNYNLNG